MRKQRNTAWCVNTNERNMLWYSSLNWKRLIIGLSGLLIAIPTIYILASFVGALVPGNIVSHSADAAESKIKHIYLLTSMLHADIAIPVDADVLQNFSFLKDSGINLEQPGLRYLIFGWGSKEFYTTAGSYADITFSATFKAITGDTSVMHVVASGQLVANDNSTKIDMSSPGFARLISFLRSSFAKDGSIGPIWLKGQSHGYGDVFYQAIGNFNIFNPCNIWTAEALKTAGIQAGFWTPTTYSLNLALSIHN